MRPLTFPLALFVLNVTLFGCATVPLAPESADRAAKGFAPPAGKAGLYVYRPSAFAMSAVTVNVKLNGRALGLLKVGTYLHAVLEPGTYTLVSQSQVELPVQLQVEPDRTYFFEQLVREGAFWHALPTTTLAPIDEARGRDAVAQSTMAATHLPDGPAVPGAGCTRDTDCKGTRVCTAGTCSEP
ncbi:MAG: DUF2846 domain-containing protein [Myxococcaceae bacterium]|nr:DUF2846 domain-containing protein [Myxococcaceae bacterium]